MTHDSAETLSSAQTFFAKFVAPVILIGIFAAVTVSLFVAPGSWRDAPPDPVVKWLFPAGAVVAAGLYWAFSAGLKVVRMDDTALYISNYREEIVVPLATVADVTEHKWIKGHPVTVHFHSDTAFGEQVTFLPKARMWLFPWSSHPVVEQIRQAADRAIGRRRG